MRGRKEHVITSTTGDAQPRRLVAVAVETEPTETARGCAYQGERLVRWVSVGWERYADGTYRDWRCHSDSLDRWWRAWLWGAKRGGVTWLVAHRAVRVASLLDLWGMIDGGSILLDGDRGSDAQGGRGAGDVPALWGNDHGGSERGNYGRGGDVSVLHADVRHYRRGGNGQTGGYGTVSPSVVIDDPPTVLRTRMPGRPGRLWWHDLRNWGIDLPPGSMTAQEEALYIASAMRRMVDELAARGWGGLKATAGSQALATWRRAYMTHPVVAHNDDEVLSLERASYVGGRCECGVIGPITGPLYWIDRHSAYAHACATLDVPVRVIGRHDGRHDIPHRDQARRRRCLAECDLDTPEAGYPTPTKDGVRYPVGRISVCLAGPEFDDACERGVVRRIYRCVEYECAPALRAYALALWSARRRADRRGDVALGQWLKKLLVGLPGKLGQRCASWVAAPDVPPPARWCAWHGYDRERGLYRYRALSGAVQEQQREEWTYDSAPAVASWILSAARVELLRAIRAAGWSECLYWDTDSLLLTEAGWTRIQGTPGLVGCDLGQWRLVRTVARAIIHGVKHYDHDGDLTCAGRPRLDCQDTRLRDHYWYRQSFGMALTAHSAPAAVRELRQYGRPPRYTLGRIGDGGRVYPHVAEDW